MSVEESWDEEEPHFCSRCWGEGEIVICVDDLCQAAGHCMHGDGMAVCPDCNGEPQ